MKSTKTHLSLIVFLFLFVSSLTYSQEVKPQFGSKNLTTVEGEKISSSELEGKFRIVHLWGTWCAPCIKEIPVLNDFKQSYSDREDVVFLAVGISMLDTDNAITDFLKKKRFDFTHLSTSEDSTFFEFNGQFSAPITLLYDKSGKLVFTQIGTLEPENFEELKQLLK